MKRLLFLSILVASFSSSASTFNEVWNVVTDKNFVPQTDVERSEFAIYQEHLLPVYPVNSASVFATDGQLKADAKRTVSSSADYFSRLPKLLHANGVCVAGIWEVTQPTAYTGMFSQGSKGLFVGRVSVTMDRVLYHEKRGFGFAGKIFPTMDPNQDVHTANFFSVDVLMGNKKSHFLQAAMTNEPETGFDLSLIGLGFRIASALSSADHKPGFRPLYPISESGLSSDQVAVTPHWVRFSVARGTILNDEDDFRNEVIRGMNQNDGLKIVIQVSDETKDRMTNSGWTSIGTIQLNQVSESYGCDRRLHFPHPKLNVESR